MHRLSAASRVKIPPGANSGQTLRLKGKGVPAGGDQYVRLTVMLPGKADEQLAKFVEDWPGADGYDPRRKAGLS